MDPNTYDQPTYKTDTQIILFTKKIKFSTNGTGTNKMQ